LSTC